MRTSGRRATAEGNVQAAAPAIGEAMRQSGRGGDASAGGEMEGGRGQLLLSARLQRETGLKRSMSTGQLRALVQTEVEALEDELYSTATSSSTSSAPKERPTSRTDDLDTVADDEDYAAQLLGREAATPKSSERKAAEPNRQRQSSSKPTTAKVTGKEENQQTSRDDIVAELFRVLNAESEAVSEGSSHEDPNTLKVDHSYFIGWLQKARIFNRIDLIRRNRPPQSESASDDLDVLLEAETIDYAKGALSYYQRCLSLLPHLSHLTAQELKEAKTCLFAELGAYYLERNNHRKALQIAVALLSEDNGSLRLQDMLRKSAEVLASTADASDGAFIVNTISKLKMPVPALTDFIGATFMRVEPLLQYCSGSPYIEARVGIVNWYRRLLAETRIKQHRNKPPLSVSMRLSNGLQDKSEHQSESDKKEMQLILDLLVGYRERDMAEEVRNAAKEAIEQVGDFTLEVVEEGYEHVEGEDAVGHVLTIQVHIESLIQRSSYFKTMLSLEMLEKQTQRLRVVTSQPHAFLDMIDYLYRQEVCFESVDHAIAMYMVSNQYGVEELKYQAVNYINTNSSTYISEIVDDFEKIKEVYYIADTLLPATQLKSVLFENLTANNSFFRNNSTLPPKGSVHVQQLRELHQNFPSLFQSVSTYGLISKLKPSVQRDDWELCEFIADLLRERRKSSPETDQTSISPAPRPLPPPPPQPVNSQLCSECGVVMGHLTTCSQFPNFRNIAGRARAQVPLAPPQPSNQSSMIDVNLLLDVLSKEDTNWMIVARRLLASGFCYLDGQVICSLLEKNKLSFVEEIFEILGEQGSSKLHDEGHEDDKKGKDKASDHAEDDASSEHTWQWEGDTVDDWHDYDSISCGLIESAFLAGQSSVLLDHGLFVTGTTYTVDLVRQQQKNNSSNMERNIRRKPQPHVASTLHPAGSKANQWQLALLMNQPQADGKTLLMHFIEKHVPLRIIKQLLELGKGIIDLNIKATVSSFGDTATALSLAIMQMAQWDEAAYIVRLLLSMGADPNVILAETSLHGKKDTTALLLAIKQNNVKLVQILIDAGADVIFNVAPTSPDPTVYTYHSNLAYDPSEDLIASLNSSADRNPIFVACCMPRSEENIELVKLLIERGAIPKSATQHSGLGQSARAKPMPPPPVLSLPGTTTSTSSSMVVDSKVRGNTPLMAAAFYGREDLVQLLLGVGQEQGNKERKDKEKDLSELDSTSDAFNVPPSPVSYLCDVNARNWWHWTPLHFATWAGREDVVRLLCQVPGVKDSEAVVSTSGIVNTARQMAADRQLNRILPALCTLPIAEKTRTVRASSQTVIEHSAELAPLQTFTSVSSLGSGATATAMTNLAPPKPKKKLWDRLKFL